MKKYSVIEATISMNVHDMMLTTMISRMHINLWPQLLLEMGPLVITYIAIYHQNQNTNGYKRTFSHSMQFKEYIIQSYKGFYLTVLAVIPCMGIFIQTCASVAVPELVTLRSIFTRIFLTLWVAARINVQSGSMEKCQIYIFQN